MVNICCHVSLRLLFAISLSCVPVPVWSTLYLYPSLSLSVLYQHYLLEYSTKVVHVVEPTYGQGRKCRLCCKHASDGDNWRHDALVGKLDGVQQQQVHVRLLLLLMDVKSYVSVSCMCVECSNKLTRCAYAPECAHCAKVQNPSFREASLTRELFNVVVVRYGTCLESML